jgi:sugar transferase (PEP-CTERM/EpsH1 system associated)
MPSPAGEVLLLCHRIPYPPDKGDKIRSWHWLSALAEHRAVHLGAFVDDPEDWAHVGHLRERCAEVLLLPLSSKLRGLWRFRTGQALTMACYCDRRMANWVDGLLQRRSIAQIVVYSSAMAQYARLPTAAGKRRIIDFVDVDADKWRQYAERSAPPTSWLYAREARLLLEHDAEAARCFDASLFVSPAEAALFQGQTAIADKVYAVPNGVDADFFSPLRARPSPFEEAGSVVVFTGAMDYRANIDAVRWFVTEVWPQVRVQAPTARFYIVGARPTSEVRALRRADVVVTGRVEDVRPYLQHAAAVVAPIRIARGIQNKVMEGMAMGRVVLTTPMGAEGIEATAGQHLLVAEDPADFAARTVQVLLGAHAAIGPAARRLVREHYTWRGAIGRFLRIVTGDVVRERDSA